jgi:hypothetical protein
LNAIRRHLDRVSVAEPVGREAAAHACQRGDVPELGARGRR